VKETVTNAIEVKLVSVKLPGNGSWEARYVLALHQEALASELTVTNANTTSSSVALSGAVSNHLSVSTTEDTT
jgi:hypothetical protein